jgi:hypothetical protein
MTKPDRDQAERFLHALDPGATRFTFQTFDDNQERDDKSLAKIHHGTLNQQWRTLVRLNEARAGVFITVNETDFQGRKTDNIKRVRACFVDLDGAAFPESPHLKPHIVTETSPGRWHLYWLVKDCPLDKFTEAQKRLISHYSGDPAIHDLPRVMRFPGFYHRKGEPFIARLVDATDLPPYTIDQLLKGLPEPEKPRQPGNGQGHHHSGDSFWQRVNTVALGQLDRWVRNLFPTARFQPGTGAWRVTSKDLGRSLEEDLSLSPKGIYDFGTEKPLSAIETIFQFGTATTAKDAALWLCGQMGIDPATLGWSDSALKSNGQDKKTQQWPEPHPLPDSLLPVAAFDFELIPEQVRPWIADICERMQCPPDYAAVSLMAALGSMIGRKVAIRPQAEDDWEVIANQWALGIGRPGVLKTPAMEEVLKPLHRLSAIAQEKLKKDMATYEVMAAIAKLRHKDNMDKASKILKKDRDADVSYLLEGEGKVSEPTLKRYIANDTNVASLGVLLQQNPNGLLVFRDEIVSLLDNLDREECISERGFYLTGWSGNSRYTFDRIGRGLHLGVEGVCLSMLGSSQPGRIRSIFCAPCAVGVAMMD